jgi:GT2 family glycosyltransferase
MIEQALFNNTADDSMDELPLLQSSVIICSRNRERLLLDTVRSILSGNHLPTEIVIVDQSDQPSMQLATLCSSAACEIRYIWSNERGVSIARNRGVAEARHELLVLTDDDMIAPADWFATLARALLRGGADVVVTGKVLATQPEALGGFAPSVIQSDESKVYKGRTPADVLYTGNMAIYRALLERMGGFDKRLGPGTPFPAAEDNDLGFRLLEMGFQIHYEPRALLYHRSWRAGEEYLQCRWRYNVGQGAFYAKHLSLTDRFMLKRMLRHLQRRIKDSCWIVFVKRRNPSVQLVSAAGLIYGALRWTMAHRVSGS